LTAGLTNLLNDVFAMKAEELSMQTKDFSTRVSECRLKQTMYGALWDMLNQRL